MSSHSLRPVIALAALALLVPSAAAQQKLFSDPVPVNPEPKAGIVIVENATPFLVAVTPEYIIDAKGKRHDWRPELGGYLLPPPDPRNPQAVTGQDGARVTPLVDPTGVGNVVAKEFGYRLTTADGESRGWKVIGSTHLLVDREVMWIVLDEKTIKEHQKRIADDRKNNAGGRGTLYVQVPPGATITVDESFKPGIRDGGAFIVSGELKPGRVLPQKVRVELVSGGQTYKEEAEFLLEPGLPLRWDCRDIVAPDRLARTVRYVLACRQASDGVLEKSWPGGLWTVGKRFKGMPVRGVDEDAVKFNTSVADAYLGLYEKFKAGTATQKEVDAVFADFQVKAPKVRKLLEDRYGDRYVQALANGGTVPAAETALKQPVAPPRLATAPRQEQMGQAVTKIGVALAAYLAATKLMQKNPDDRAALIGAGLALRGRDAAIESALADLFPSLSPRQAGDIQKLATSILEGKRTLDPDAQKAKDRLIADLRTANPDLAEAAMIADFVFTLSQLPRR